MMLSLLAAAALCVDHVHDGDSLTSCSGERVRIENIDAGELPGSPRCRRLHGRAVWACSTEGFRARDALTRMIASGQPTIVRSGRDRYGRTLARVRVNGIDVGERLVAMGLARRWY